ncbi:MAG: polysaccharide deacetylase family protein [Acidimicrobiales bacterium]|nr:polysaccharide deacetylase family protein [Acidimicrobiales bacterium]
MPRALAFDALVRRVAPALPLPVVERWARRAIGGREAALCLHRVGAGPADASGLVLPAPVLDELVAAAERIGRGRRWLALTFDDGYLDAVRYVAERAERHPTIGWHLFICPDKAAGGRGFRWDAGLDPFTELPADVAALEREHDRRALVRAGADERCALAGIELLRTVRDAGFAEVGNHTDHHLPLASLAAEVATAELAGSVASFERELGACRSFAFPFGTPGLYWRAEHAEQLRAAGVEQIWSVQSRTFTAAERTSGAVLPRFPVDGRDDARTIVALVAARATLERVRALAAGRHGPAGPTSSAAAATRYVRDEPLVHLAGPVAAESDRAPTVFVYGASGHVETFRALAAVLGASRPVYAVRALGLLEGERPAGDVAEALEVAIDAVKQLGRPVELVGYSLGGLVALGMAGPLERAELLAGPVRLIDTYAGSLEVLPLSTRLRNALAFTRRHGVRRVLPWSRRLVERQVRGALRRPAPRPAWLEELGFGEGRVAGLVDLEAHHRALLGDTDLVEPYRGPVRTIRSLDLAPNLPEDAGVGRLLQGPLDVRFVRGDHFSMLSPHRVQRLVAALFH